MESAAVDLHAQHLLKAHEASNARVSEALDLKPVLSVEAGGDKLLLLRRGGAIGMADRF